MRCRFPGRSICPSDRCRVPPNVKFEVDDCEQPWTFPQPFDYIHVRYMIAAIRDWRKLFRQTYQHTKPGGWAEFQDFDAKYYSEDSTFVEGSVVDTWQKTWVKATIDSGIEAFVGPQLEGWMLEAGFQNVKAEKFRIPIGPWPKDKHLVSDWRVLHVEEESSLKISATDKTKPRKPSARGIWSNSRTEWRLSTCASILSR